MAGESLRLIPHDQLEALYSDQRELVALREAAARHSKSHREDLERMNGVLAELRREAGAHEGMLQRVTDRMADLTEQAAARHSEVARLRKQAAARRDEVARLTDDAAVQGREVARLNGEVARLNGKVARLTEDAGARGREVARLKQEVAVRDGEVVLLAREVERLHNEVALRDDHVALLTERLECKCAQLDGIMKADSAAEGVVNAGVDARMAAFMAKYSIGFGHMLRTVGCALWGEGHAKTVDTLTAADKRAMFVAMLKILDMS